MLMATTTAPMAPSGRARQKSRAALRQPPRSTTSGTSPRTARSTAITEPGAGTRALATPAPRRDHASWSFGSPIRAVPSSESDARVDPGVRQVNQEVHEDEDERDEHHERLRERVVAVGHRLDEEEAESVEVEHLLGDDEAAHEERELEGDHGEHRQHRVLERVPRQDQLVPQSLGPGRADVVLAQIG